jgi:CHRD domain
MHGKRVYLALTAVMVLALGVASFAVADNGGKRGQKSGRLHGYNEVPPISTTGKGTFRLSVDRNAQRIEFRLTYEGLTGNAAQAHIHFGQKDVNGGISAFLCGGSTKPACPTGTSGTVTGTIVPADVLATSFAGVNQGIAAGEWNELVAAIRAGVTYANVHTAAAPGGEIRAQIKRVGNVDDDGD